MKTKESEGMKVVVVIPARYDSSRLPGKPLLDIHGKTLLQRTYEQCIKAVPRDEVYVATDDERIKAHCLEENINVVMTSKDCLTGTDRIAEFSKIKEADLYINVQGDEPLMNPQDITAIKKAALAHPDEIINGYANIETEKQYRSLTIPKVVIRPDGRLLYMSRSPIPGNKKDKFQNGHRQICVYAFPKRMLDAFYGQNEKTPLEASEDIEILRFLELGYEVRMVPLTANSVAVDTTEDLALVKEIIEEHEGN